MSGGRIRRTTTGQALAGILTAEAVAARERNALDLHTAQVPAILEELAAKRCARPSCGHIMEAHGAPRGELAAFHRHTCTVIPGLAAGVCSCTEFLHEEPDDA